MADVKNNSLNEAKQPSSGVDASPNTQGKCAHGGCAHGGCARLEDVQDKVNLIQRIKVVTLIHFFVQGVKARNKHILYRENGTMSTPYGQERSEVSKAPPSYSMGRWLGEGPKEGHWNSHSCGSLG